MSVAVEKLEKSMAKLTIEVSAEDFDKAINKVYLKQRGTAPAYSLRMPLMIRSTALILRRRRDARSQTKSLPTLTSSLCRQKPASR